MILSDGLTDQGERQTLLRLIQSRPVNAKVFCIGVGNDVNRPLLEQIAGDSGGLASFLSQGDDFKRQAQAFRRKLMNPVATDLELRLGGPGVEITELEPKLMPNLFHGSPVRVYGRYRGHGPVKAALRGNLQGTEWKQTADVELPAADASSPEIERMWAWQRIDALLKESDRQGSRDAVIPEIVRLGEEFSIATEYTSFLVLENDAELQRWKIERRNAARLGRDRQSQAARETQLAAWRQKAIANLGPDAAPRPESTAALPAQSMPHTSPSAPVPPPAFPVGASPDASPRPAAPPVQSQSRNFFGGGGGGGSGPVGPLFVALSAWLARRRQKLSSRPPAPASLSHTVC